MDPWDEVPDVALDGRSIVPFPEPDPEGVAAMWDRWRTERATHLRVDAPDPDAGLEVYKNHEPPIVTLEAEEFDEPLPALSRFVKLAVDNGWNLIELAHAKCTARGKVIQSGARAGQRHPDRAIETQWIKIEKPGVGRAVISYMLVNGKSDSTGTYRSCNGLPRADAEMKGIIRDGIVQQEREAED